MLVNDSLRFILSVRSDVDARFYDLAEADFNNRFSPEDDAASFIVI
jgi:hypothetical protein